MRVLTKLPEPQCNDARMNFKPMLDDTNYVISFFFLNTQTMSVIFCASLTPDPIEHLSMYKQQSFLSADLQSIVKSYVINSALRFYCE